VIGTGSVVRWVGEDDLLSADEGIVVAMDDGEHVEPWCCLGASIFVPPGECEASR